MTSDGFRMASLARRQGCYAVIFQPESVTSTRILVQLQALLARFSVTSRCRHFIHLSKNLDAMFKIALIDSHLSKKGDFTEIKKICEENGGEFIILECKTEDEVVAGAHDADALLVVYFKVGESLLTRLPKCRLAVRLGIGVDNYDLDAFTRHGVIACNVPDYGVEEVAAHTLGMILCTERKIVYFDKQVRNGIWDDAQGYNMHRLSQRTLGFFGFGRIARKLATSCATLNYRVIAYDPMLKDEVFTEYGAQRVTVEELFSQADTLTLMAPSTAETHHIVNAKNLALAKDGLRIVNTARGELINNADLIAALESGKVAAAGLDVVEGEPIKDVQHALLQFDSVFLTPHTAYQTVESVAILKRMAMETAVGYLTQQQTKNVVNPQVLTQLKTIS